MKRFLAAIFPLLVSCGGTPQNPSAVVPCDSIGGQQAVYWPHHGFVENGILHAYMIRIVFDPVLWFRTDGLVYVRFSLPDYTVMDISEVASFAENHVWYGWGFYNKKLLYTVPEPSEDSELYSYNAMAHPQYSKDGKLLVSYCINSHRPGRLWEDVSVYRPRFLRVPYSLILGQDQ